MNAPTGSASLSHSNRSRCRERNAEVEGGGDSVSPEEIVIASIRYAVEYGGATNIATTG